VNGPLWLAAVGVLVAPLALAFIAYVLHRARRVRRGEES